MEKEKFYKFFINYDKRFSDEIFLEKNFIFLNELILWNKKFNLVGYKDEQEVVLKLFIDSLSLVNINIVSQCETIFDLGSGAGFPGIPNAIFFKDKLFYLIESNKKKAKFLENIKSKLELKNILILNDRAEELARRKEYREKFDCGIIKAFNPFNISMEIAIPFLKVDRYCVFYASKNQVIKIENNYDNLKKELALKIENVYKYKLPEIEEERYLVIVKKMWKTCEKYPRKYKFIKEKPIY